MGLASPGQADHVPGGQLVTIVARRGGRPRDRGPVLWAGILVPATALALLFLVVLAALIFGITMMLPIGGADMPVVISLLNSFTGTAAAMAGFVLDNPVLIIAGALVGASGAILTKLMADAMNRSVMNIMVGGFGGGERPQARRRWRRRDRPRDRRRRRGDPAGLRPVT